MARHSLFGVAPAVQSWVFSLWTATVGLVLVGWYVGAALLGGLSILVTYLFRDPARTVPAAPLGIVSPLDGQVVGIDERDDPYRQLPSRRVRIRSTPLGPYLVRSPSEGKVANSWAGNRLGGCGAGVATSATARELVTDEGDRMLFAVYSPRWWIKPRCRVVNGERLGQGQRCGFIFFLGCVELYLPLTAKMKVKEGDRLMAGSDLLATLVREPTPSGERQPHATLQD